MGACKRSPTLSEAAKLLVYRLFSVTLQGSVENDGRFAHFLFVAQD
jgi:hypothetical protein